MVPPNLIEALLAANFHERYYAICEAHKLRAESTCKSGAKEIIEALIGIGTVSKLKGPGRVFAVAMPEQPESLQFIFIIQSAGVTLEPCLSITEQEKRMGSNFSVLAYAANQAAGRMPLKPPYPRPAFYSLEELSSIVAPLRELAMEVGGAFYAQQGAQADGPASGGSAA